MDKLLFFIILFQGEFGGAGAALGFDFDGVGAFFHLRDVDVATVDVAWHGSHFLAFGIKESDLGFG